MVVTRSGAQSIGNLYANNMVENAEDADASGAPAISMSAPHVSFTSAMEDELVDNSHLVDSSHFRKQPKLPKLPLLRNALQLKAHINWVEEWLIEEGFVLDSVKAKTAIVDSLHMCADIHASALSLIAVRWQDLKTALLNTFCDSNFIRASIEMKLAELKFDERQMLTFVQEARTLHALLDPDFDMRWFCDKVFAVLPRYVLRDLIDRARARDSRADWRSHDFHWLLSTLTDVLNSVMALNQLKPVVPYRPKGLATPSADKVRLVQTKGSGTWLTDWVKQFKSVYVVNGPASEKLNSVLHTADEHKKMRNKRDGSDYYFVAFKQDGTNAMRALPPKSYKLFEQRSSKNLEGAE